MKRGCNGIQVEMTSNFIVNVSNFKGRENFAELSLAIENFQLQGFSKCTRKVVEDEDGKSKPLTHHTLTKVIGLKTSRNVELL